MENKVIAADAKVIAMINDLSTASLVTLLLFHPNLVAKLREAAILEYKNGRLDPDFVRQEWESEHK